MPPSTAPDARDIRRWRGYLADERAERQVYAELARRRTGEDREILLALAEAERRHEQHWVDLLGERAEPAPRPSLDVRLLGTLARRFGSVFALALMQRAEARSPYAADAHATEQMAADEQIHGEVVRGLAARGRRQLAGSFRAAVFGANDGLVSNLALVTGIGAVTQEPAIVLATGIAGLLSGALSMGAGEYVSVRSQRELLGASRPDHRSVDVIDDLDLNTNELALVFRARGLTPDEAEARAGALISDRESRSAGLLGGIDTSADAGVDPDEAVGSAWSAAISSFLFFGGGALIPVLPFLFGMVGLPAIAVSLALVGVALLLSGALVGIMSGASPGKRALRQLAIGFGAAGATYLLGRLFGATMG
ncbi:VIT1/CCC1 transporter family protein [Naumannella cuiyingiana]|uniref:VIT1/CCC1 family predicted Fe2+/Mn2+ transporter n=1 Tax=Naumannella cuiyingiana TaxID=1347891 RepID=A0A7Z0D726_9ACTN|nr:VIT1/CCC1 family protein [Naumannella cuiyingiana]NYI70059.1 VIT1/CCC1 family predicted Fe2+/Mn2+ transporter [Naumannella cuiyingiana]